MILLIQSWVVPLAPLAERPLQASQAAPALEAIVSPSPQGKASLKPAQGREPLPSSLPTQAREAPPPPLPERAIPRPWFPLSSWDLAWNRRELAKVLAPNQTWEKKLLPERLSYSDAYKLPRSGKTIPLLCPVGRSHLLLMLPETTTLCQYCHRPIGKPWMTQSWCPCSEERDWRDPILKAQATAWQSWSTYASSAPRSESILWESFGTISLE